MIVMGGDSSPLPSVPTVLRALDPPPHTHPSNKSSPPSLQVPEGHKGYSICWFGASYESAFILPINPRICISLLAILNIILFLLYVYGSYWSGGVGAQCVVFVAYFSIHSHRLCRAVMISVAGETSSLLEKFQTCFLSVSFSLNN